MTSNSWLNWLSVSSNKEDLARYQRIVCILPSSGRDLGSSVELNQSSRNLADEHCLRNELQNETLPQSTPSLHANLSGSSRVVVKAKAFGRRKNRSFLGGQLLSRCSFLLPFSNFELEQVGYTLHEPCGRP